VKTNVHLSQLFPPNAVELHVIYTILGAADGDLAWKGRILDTIASDWTSGFGQVVEVEFEAFARSVLREAPNEEFWHFRVNLWSLLFSGATTPTQPPTTVLFEEYLALMLRYGPQSRIIESIRGLSGPIEADQTAAAFHDWFHPELGETGAIRLLTEADDGAWLVRPSSSVSNCFTLNSKTKGEVNLCRIRYDGLASDHQTFSLKWEGSSTKGAATLSDLLFVVLKRIETKALGPRPVGRETKQVEGHQLLSEDDDELLLGMDASLEDPLTM
jgi:hypothetical protein